VGRRSVGRRSVERLHFSRMARRRARRLRIRRRLAFLSLCALALGVPGADTGLAALQRFVGSRLPVVKPAESITTTDSAQGLMKFRRDVFQARPRPTPRGSTSPAPAPTFTPGGTMGEIIYSAAAEFGLSGDYLLSVAVCESNLDPHAINPVGYYGLFQFDETTWAAYGYGSIYDATAQARTAARLLAAGQYSRWPNCS
jgi:soluble lytic murein transglycosylase-like protein